MSRCFIVLLSVLLSAGATQSFGAAKDYRAADGEVLQDPTRPANWRAGKVAGKKAINYQLNYILNAKERKQAIVNGKKVTVGDVVQGAKVLSIDESEVVLSVSGARKVLRVNKKRSGFKK